MTTPTDKTLFFLLLEFGTAEIPVDSCAHHFGLTVKEAKRAAARQQLPIPCYRIGSRKSPWTVSSEALAKLIRTKRMAAEDEWKRIHDAD